MAPRQLARLLQRAAPAVSRVLADGGIAKPYTPFFCRSVSIFCLFTRSNMSICHILVFIIAH